MAEPNLKVSVAIIAYKHSAYISQAIESVLRQAVNFDYEIVIGEDCSPDNTGEIIRQYEELYPEKIRAIIGTENIGMHRNLERVLAACRGQYIALLEGDDFWTEVNKLQRQVNVLDAKPNAALVFHPVLYSYESSQHTVQQPVMHESNAEDNLHRLIQENYINTCSVMFRRSFFTRYHKWWHKIKIADWVLFLELAEKGELIFLPECMATYRVHPGGVWSHTKAGLALREMVKARSLFNMHSNYKYNLLVRRCNLNERYIILSEEQAERRLAPKIKLLLEGSIDSLFLPGLSKLAFAKYFFSTTKSWKFTKRIYSFLFKQ